MPLWRTTVSGVTLAPTVLILAAGQGTRMRSQTPKVLHELCGRPMVLWPVQAALEAGAEKVVVVDSPQRALEEVLPVGRGAGGAAPLGRHRRGGRGGHVPDRLGPAPVVVLSGDVPLVSAEAIRGLTEAHAQSAAAATIASTILADPSGYGRVVRDESGAVERVVETKKDGRRHHGGAARSAR